MALDSYRKLLNTAYELALNPSMPLSHFKVLVKCQRQNGVCLIDGKDDSHSCREYIHYIADTIREKVAVILGSAYFMSTLSDGSQARKVKDEKELVLVRTERNGIPVYFVASLLEMSQYMYGGTDADSIKKAIDDVFVEKLGLDEDQYVYSMISSTADGASVNFGKYRGVLTQLKLARPWLLTIHCVNHRIELSVKDALKDPYFDDVEAIYLANFKLLKNSGALKDKLKKCAAALDITHYVLPKITGTRFINHRRRGFERLLHMWPVFLTAYESALAENKQKAETAAKIQGLLSKFQNVQILYNVWTS